MMNETENAIRALELLKERKVVPVSEEKMNEFLEMAIKALEQEPKTGHWISHYDEDAKEGWYECDRCHAERAFNTDYCPDCGAKMVESHESDYKCHTCKHYANGEHDGSCGSYICKEYSNWESEDQA